MGRVGDWEARLEQLVREVRGQPFHWGETDCGSLLRRAVEAVYGLADLPRYDSAFAAWRVAQAGSVQARLQDMGFREILAEPAAGDLLARAGGIDDVMCGFVSAAYFVGVDRQAGVSVHPRPTWPVLVWRLA